MDTRWVTVALIGALGIGCSFGSVPGPTGPRTASMDRAAPPTVPETPADRAEGVLATIDPCAGPCLREYTSEAPELQVPEYQRRYVGTLDEEVRSLGFTVRWDPGTDRAEIAAGNTLTPRGDVQSDP